MVDFSKLSQTSEQRKTASLFDTFSRLDRQVSHVELRPSQQDIFKKIDDRIDQPDIVVKLSTGGGKTTTGLIYLKHMMDRYKEPVVFLVPTLQLAEQVIDEGSRIGLSVVSWGSGESYPPEAAVQCNALMVCTYDKFFNGKSTFGRADVRLTPCALVLDDVHAGIESIKKCFSADISNSAKDELIALLGEKISQAEPAAWSLLQLPNTEGILEVPHWILSDNLEGVREILSRHSNESPLLFAWPFLSKSLELCRLIISARNAVIAVDPPLIGYVDHYVRVRHRLFMSASIHDGGPLIRELGCNADAAASPIEVNGDGSVGERMVLVPSLVEPKFTREDLRKVVTNFVATTNVVILVSSEAAAQFWVESGAVKAQGDAFSLSIAKLKREVRGNFVVFVNRFDGVDLPDSACRILVIDGLPSGESIIDRLDNENAGGVVGMRGKLANRVEQGLGRAVRSNSDYCAVILAGQDLSNFVSRRVVLESFSPSVVRQIEIGRDISKAIANEQDKVSGVIGAITQLMSRDDGWRNYYVSQMQKQSEISQLVAQEAILRRNVAVAERKAATASQSRDYSQASRVLRDASNLYERDKFARGVIKQSASKLMYLHDTVGAMDLQSSAYADNYNLSRPPIMPSTFQRRISSQAEYLADWLRNFEDLNGAIIELDQLVSRLSYSNSNEVIESAIADLGKILGADSSRPEKVNGRGPDNLWVFENCAFCIEMKNEKKAKLWKKDAGQISVSERWVKEFYPGLEDVYPIIGSDVVIADCATDFSSNVLVLTSDAIKEVSNHIRALLVGLITHGPLFAKDPANIQGQLGRNGVLPKQIISYLSKVS